METWEVDWKKRGNERLERITELAKRLCDEDKHTDALNYLLTSIGLEISLSTALNIQIQDTTRLLIERHDSGANQRDQIAMAALTGMASGDPESDAEMAYDYADAMLKARAKVTP